MTISPFIIYLWGIADSLKGLFIMLASASGLVAFGIAMVANIEDKPELLKWLWKVAPLGIALAVLATLTPNSKTIAAMVIAPQIINSRVIQQDIPELYEAAISAMKDSLKPKRQENP